MTVVVKVKLGYHYLKNNKKREGKIQAFNMPRDAKVGDIIAAYENRFLKKIAEPNDTVVFQSLEFQGTAFEDKRYAVDKDMPISGVGGYKEGEPPLVNIVVQRLKGAAEDQDIDFNKFEPSSPDHLREWKEELEQELHRGGSKPKLVKPAVDSSVNKAIRTLQQENSALETEVKHLRLMFFELKDQVQGNMIGTDVQLRQFRQMLGKQQQQQPVDHMKQLIDKMLKAEKIPVEDIGYVMTMTLPPITDTDEKEELERRRGARKLFEEIQMTIPKGYLGKQPKDRKEEDYTQEQSDLLRSQLQSLYSIVWPEKQGMQKYAEASAAGPADDGPPVYHPDPHANVLLM